MLLSYAKNNGFIIYDEYVDDGWTGTNFERPAFKRMINDIENKKINLVITKDLSRLGRDYITTGKYTEIYFPSKSVRYIAINDGYDSEDKYNDIIPFKNIMNEMYARDTSKKIRSAFLTKMTEGNFIGNFAPYGYKKDPLNKNHLIPDNESSLIVKKIFNMASNGETPIMIARYLNKNNILTPAEYRCKLHPYLNVYNYTKRREWCSGTITKILKNKVYIGYTLQGKTTRISFKSEKQITRPENEWIIVEGTHEPIIDKEVFELVNMYCLRRKCDRSKNFNNIFSGIARCMDCGKGMSTVITRKKGGTANLACGGYKLRGVIECTNHFIDYDDLYNIVLESINRSVNFQEFGEDDIYKDNEEKKYLNRLNKLKRDMYQIDLIIERLYEDRINDVINQERLKKLVSEYECKCRIITEEMEQISEMIEKISKNKMERDLKTYDASKMKLRKLNLNIILRLIDHIEIGQGNYELLNDRKVKKQNIRIYFRFMGNNEKFNYLI